MDEIALAKAAIAGDERAQLQLLKLYEPQMYKVAYSYMRNEHDAKDALQEMYYSALKNFHTVKSPEYLKTWLVRIVINTCNKQKSKTSKWVLSDEINEQTVVHSELFELNDAVARLSVEQQQLIHLKFFKDLKNSDIAEMQNIPEGTVKSRLHNALKKLRKMLEGEAR